MVQTVQAFAPSRNPMVLSQSSTADHMVPRVSSALQAIGPDVSFPKDGYAMEIWSAVRCNDQYGVQIDGLKEGDVVEIVSTAGYGSFASSDQTVLKAITGIAKGLLIDGMSYYTKDRLEETQKEISEAIDDIQSGLGQLKNKRRDIFGMDPDSGDFAKNEGGIIMCMPGSKGTVYAAPDNYLAGGAKENGRKPGYFSSNIKELNCWFPFNGSGGIMKKTCEEDGVLNILPFDSRFNDNSGAYEMKLKITRPDNRFRHKELCSMLDNLPPGGDLKEFVANVKKQKH